MPCAAAFLAEQRRSREWSPALDQPIGSRHLAGSLDRPPGLVTCDLAYHHPIYILLDLRFSAQLQIEREELHAERVGSFAAARLRRLSFFRSQVPRHRADRGLDSLLFSVAQIVN